MTAREFWEQELAPFSLRARPQTPLIQNWKRRKPERPKIPTLKRRGK